MTDYVLKAEPAMVVLTPYALARSSHHLFRMARSYEDEKDAFLIRHYLFCVAIELGMKAAILGEDCTKANKERMKKIGHDLTKLNDQFESTFGTALLDADDLDALGSINPHFKRKGLEYFTLPVLESTVQGHSGLPELGSVQAVANKVDAFLVDKGFYLEGKTSDTPKGRGILHFV